MMFAILLSSNYLQGQKTMERDLGFVQGIGLLPSTEIIWEYDEATDFMIA